MEWTIPGRQKTFGADISRQGREILNGQFLAGTRDFPLSDGPSWFWYTPHPRI